MAPQQKRRELLVDKELQLGLTVRLLCWLMVYALIVIVVTYAPVLVDAFSGNASSAAYDAAWKELTELTTFSAKPVVILFFAGLHLLVFMHRVAGPVYRFRQTLRSMAQRWPSTCQAAAPKPR